MATVPVRLAIDELPAQLARLRAELREGHIVELMNGEEIVGELHVSRSAVLPPFDEHRRMPDFVARLRAIYGDKPLDVDTTAWVREDRDGDDDLPGYWLSAEALCI